MPRRSRSALEGVVREAPSEAARAIAWYELGVFHDNNGREAAAIPCYESALALVLEASTRARCLAWLASSLYKTGQAAEGLRRVEEAEAASTEVELGRFLSGLRRRIEQG